MDKRRADVGIVVYAPDRSSPMRRRRSGDASSPAYRTVYTPSGYDAMPGSFHYSRRVDAEDNGMDPTPTSTPPPRILDNLVAANGAT